MRHSELFDVLAGMALDGGGDALVATIALRERGKLESVGELPYLLELQNGAPSAENIQKSVVDGKWERIIANSKNSNSEKEQ